MKKHWRLKMDILAATINAGTPAEIPALFEIVYPILHDAELPAEVPRLIFSNKSNGKALSLTQIREFLFEMSAGMPKVVSGRLCALRFNTTALDQLTPADWDFV